MDWNLFLTILSVIGILISGSVWVVVLITRVTTRVRDAERDILDQKEKVKEVKNEVERKFEEVKNESIIMEKKIEKIEAGEFVEKIVKNVIYSPESRQYFSTIFTEALKHQNKNNTAANLSILDFQEEINKKLEEINDKLPQFLKK